MAIKDKDNEQKLSKDQNDNIASNLRQSDQSSQNQDQIREDKGKIGVKRPRFDSDNDINPQDDPFQDQNFQNKREQKAFDKSSNKKEVLERGGAKIQRFGSVKDQNFQNELQESVIPKQFDNKFEIESGKFINDPNDPNAPQEIHGYRQVQEESVDDSWYYDAKKEDVQDICDKREESSQGGWSNSSQSAQAAPENIKFLIQDKINFNKKYSPDVKELAGEFLLKYKDYVLSDSYEKEWRQFVIKKINSATNNGATNNGGIPAIKLEEAKEVVELNARPNEDMVAIVKIFLDSKPNNYEFWNEDKLNTMVLQLKRDGYPLDNQSDFTLASLIAYNLENSSINEVEERVKRSLEKRILDSMFEHKGEPTDVFNMVGFLLNKLGADDDALSNFIKYPPSDLTKKQIKDYFILNDELQCPLRNFIKNSSIFPINEPPFESIGILRKIKADELLKQEIINKNIQVLTAIKKYLENQEALGLNPPSLNESNSYNLVYQASFKKYIKKALDSDGYLLEQELNISEESLCILSDHLIIKDQERLNFIQRYVDSRIIEKSKKALKYLDLLKYCQNSKEESEKSKQIKADLELIKKDDLDDSVFKKSPYSDYIKTIYEDVARYVTDRIGQDNLQKEIISYQQMAGRLKEFIEHDWTYKNLRGYKNAKDIIDILQFKEDAKQIDKIWQNGILNDLRISYNSKNPGEKNFTNNLIVQEIIKLLGAQEVNQDNVLPETLQEEVTIEPGGCDTKTILSE